MSNYQSVREHVFRTSQDAVREQLLQNSSGDLSARTLDGNIAISPHKARFHRMSPQEITIVDPDGEAIDAFSLPTEDLELHLYVYENMPHVNAILHTHSPYAVAFSMLGEPVPPMNVELVQCGAPLPITSDSYPGSRVEGSKVVEILQRTPGLKVVLLRNHGLIAVGVTLEEAFEAAYNAEAGLRAYHLARQIGKPQPIPPKLHVELKRAYEL